VRPGQQVQVPLYASFLTGSQAYGDALVVRAELYGWNDALERAAVAGELVLRLEMDEALPSAHSDTAPPNFGAIPGEGCPG
jgi:hypothetical protein